MPAAKLSCSTSDGHHAMVYGCREERPHPLSVRAARLCGTTGASQALRPSLLLLSACRAVGLTAVSP